MAKYKRESFNMDIDREYFPCGCAYLIDLKTGEALYSFPCEMHKRATLTGNAPEI